ncbi:hypothetical protein GGD69_007124 [Paraburkholderia fungorum]|uniref:Uncharacterized protein n=1 Tax=Paraburkholderia fungorum TaxID=134537 RepID=A0AAW3V894_9BURK|nr:hypothetical protein [Paraburkholderia fungorum]
MHQSVLLSILQMSMQGEGTVAIGALGALGAIDSIGAALALA